MRMNRSLENRIQTWMLNKIAAIVGGAPREFHENWVHDDSIHRRISAEDLRGQTHAAETRRLARIVLATFIFTFVSARILVIFIMEGKLPPELFFTFAGRMFITSTMASSCSALPAPI